MTTLAPRPVELAQRLMPLNLAAYCTWLAVVAAPVLALAQGELQLQGRTALGLGALVLFVLLFARRSQQERRYGWRAPYAPALILLQVPVALLACYALPQTTNAILLIIVAAQCFAYFSIVQSLVLLGVANLLLLAILIQRMAPAQALVLWLSFAGFQGFAALTIAAWRSAELARAEAQRMNAELRIAQQLLAEGARAQERLHLSRELHDVAGHKLTALKLQLHVLERRAEAGTAHAAQQCRQLVEELLSDLRSVVSALRQHEGMDLRRLLQTYIETFPGCDIRLELDPELTVTDMACAETLLRCAQEGVLNAVRHSRCTRILVRIRQGADRVDLEVEDDGCGLPKPGLRFGNGLTGLRERVDALSGSLSVDRAALGGTRLCVSLPR